MGILLATSFTHFLNDTIQSLFPALYPLLKTSYDLSYTQIGLITFILQMTASMFQPVVGIMTDRRPRPYSLAVAMGSTLIGLCLLSVASTFALLLVAAALVGLGSAVFHPEASRVARMASGGRHGFAQSVFQVGGSMGTAIGPLLAAFIVIPGGQWSVVWFSLLALLAMLVLWNVGGWYRQQLLGSAKSAMHWMEETGKLSRNVVLVALAALLVLSFSKAVYHAALASYYTFFLIDRFGVSVQASQVYLFVYLAAAALGTLIGGPLGDRFGRKYVIWFSVLGAVPFTLLLPYADLFWTAVLSVIIGLIMSSAFPAILVFAQELVPERVGMISGMFFGFAFGMGAIGAALLGQYADATSIDFVFKVCSFLPLLGLAAVFLPKLEARRT